MSLIWILYFINIRFFLKDPAKSLRKGALGQIGKSGKQAKFWVILCIFQRSFWNYWGPYPWLTFVYVDDIVDFALAIVKCQCIRLKKYKDLLSTLRKKWHRPQVFPDCWIRESCFRWLEFWFLWTSYLLLSLRYSRAFELDTLKFSRIAISFFSKGIKKTLYLVASRRRVHLRLVPGMTFYRIILYWGTIQSL